MSDRRYFVESIRDFEYMDKQLGRLRQWLEGYQEGGGNVPHDIDVLRQCQIALMSAKRLREPEAAVSLGRDLNAALARLDAASEAVQSCASKLSAVALEVASGIETEGHDPAEGHGAEHESPTRSEAEGDAHA